MLSILSARGVFIMKCGFQESMWWFTNVNIWWTKEIWYSIKRGRVLELRLNVQWLLFIKDALTKNCCVSGGARQMCGVLGETKKGPIWERVPSWRLCHTAQSTEAHSRLEHQIGDGRFCLVINQLGSRSARRKMNLLPQKLQCRSKHRPLWYIN